MKDKEIEEQIRAVLIGPPNNSAWDILNELTNLIAQERRKAKIEVLEGLRRFSRPALLWDTKTSVVPEIVIIDRIRELEAELKEDKEA